jgi:tripartite ATP-independent transporter DctP family solute receptor
LSKATSFFLCGLLIGILGASAGFALVTRNANSSSSSRAVTVLKLGHSLDQGHPVHIAMELMAKRLKEKSGGTVELKIFPNSQLGSETDTIEQVQRGALAMAKTSAAPIESFIPEIGVYGVPFAFRDGDHFWKFALGPDGQKLLLLGREKGIRGLCYYDAGARSFYTTDKPILKPSDLTGMKIRVQKSKTSMEMVSALGGSPTPIPWGELYTALQQSMVEGAENNTPSFYSNRHFEVCKYLSLDEHSRVPDLLLMSETIWNRLSPEVQTWVQEAADESSAYQRKLWAEKSNEAISEVEKNGVTVYRPDKRPFAEACVEMRATYDGTPIGELLKKIDEL